jgi:hypothetical protein
VAGLIRICEAVKGEDSEVALRKIRELMPALPPAATHAEAGANGGKGKKASDNVTGFRGTSETYLLRRLKRDHEELAAKVVSGEMSAHAAAIAAGFRQPVVRHPATVDGFRAGDPQGFACRFRVSLRAWPRLVR